MILEDGDVLVGDPYQIPDDLWNRIEGLPPPLKPKKKSGRPRMDDRQAMNAIFYVLRTGCQWKALPRCLGASSTVHDRFQDLWRTGLVEYDMEKRLDWKWQAMDEAITKAPLGGKKHRPQPNRQTKIWNEEKPPRRSKQHTRRTRRRWRK